MNSFRVFLKVLPFFSVLLVIILGCSLRIGLYPLLPTLFLIPVYYWLVFRPDWLPLWSLFGVGIFYDSLMGYDLGFSSLLLMLSAFLGQYVRPLLNPHRFLLIWGAFVLYSLGYTILYGILNSGRLSLFISWMYAIILYPLIAWILNHFHLRLQTHV